VLLQLRPQVCVTAVAFASLCYSSCVRKFVLLQLRPQVCVTAVASASLCYCSCVRKFADAVSLVAAVRVEHLSSQRTNFLEILCVEGAVMSIKFMIG
jgi:hypothetical protein